MGNWDWKKKANGGFSQSCLSYSSSKLTISLKSELDTGTGLALHLKEYNAGAGTRVSKDPRINTSILSHNIRDGPQDISHFTPPPSATLFHSEPEPAVNRASSSSIYRSSPEEEWYPSSSYISTPPSAAASLPDFAAEPFTGPTRQVDAYPPRNHLKYTSPPIQPNLESIHGLFTPPPSASPPPVMRSLNYIMIPRSHLANGDRIWPRQTPSEEVVASPKYEDSPSPVNEEIASPSYSPIPTLSDPGTPPPLGLEVTVESPIGEKNEETPVSANVNTQVDEASIQPPASRQVSFGTKRPRPKSPVGTLGTDRPLAKRQSLPCMQSRSSSRSDSPMTPPPDESDEEMLEEDDENEDEDEEEEEEEEDEEEDKDEKIGQLQRDFGYISEDEFNGKKEHMVIEQEEEEDEERLESPGLPLSPSHSMSHESDSDSDSDLETGCRPAESDDEPDIFPSYKVLNSNSKSVDDIDDIDLKTFDLGKLVVDCGFTDELAGLLES